MPTPPSNSSSYEGRQFHSTHWSLIVAAADMDDAEQQTALAELCQQYWYPLYGFVRRRIANPHDAQDLVQSFFLHLLENGTVGKADRSRGRFRSFLLAAMKNFQVNQWKRGEAKRRGGGVRHLPLDFAAGESWLKLEPAEHLTPQREYQRRWTLALLESVMATLRREMAAAGKAALFDHIKPALQGEAGPGFYAAAAEKLNTTPAAVKQAAHRLRRRYRDLLRREVAKTVADPAEVDDELRSLLAALG